MKIARVDICKFRIPLRKPYRVRDVQSNSRTGRLVRITTGSGATGYGEATPLPGLHSETLEDVDEILSEVAPGLGGRVFSEFDPLLERIASRVAAHGTEGAISHPTACFALQTAAMGAFAKERGLVAAQVLSDEIHMEVPVCGFFHGSPPEAEEALRTGALAGYPVVKVKVGRVAAALDRRTIDLLLDQLPHHVKLRLDANRSLSLEHAMALLHDLPIGRIEYVEEPLMDPSEMATLHRNTRLVMALDESLHDPTLGYLQRAPFVKAFVVKPAREGDWRLVKALAEEATRRACACIISSCLETGIGLWALTQMAAALPGELAAAGLATNTLLGADMLKPRFNATSGGVQTTEWQDTPSPNILRQLKFVSLTG